MDENAMSSQIFEQIHETLLGHVGGVEGFSGNWSNRSHYPVERAKSALAGGAQSIADGIKNLKKNCANEIDISEWTQKAVKLWLGMQAAGARTANPMITGPANFPTARNQKANATEMRRIDEFYSFVDRADSWLAWRRRKAERAAISEIAATVQHRTLDFPGVSLVQNETLDRIQLVFDGKPPPETIAELKRGAFRWSPREGAWQRKNTNNGVQAAHRLLRFLGHDKGKLR